MSNASLIKLSIYFVALKTQFCKICQLGMILPFNYQYIYIFLIQKDTSISKTSKQPG